MKAKATWILLVFVIMSLISYGYSFTPGAKFPGRIGKRGQEVDLETSSKQVGEMLSFVSFALKKTNNVT